MPVFMGVSENKNAESIFFDQDWKLCNECGCIFLSPLMPLEMVYQTNHHFEPIGEVWTAHHINFAEFIHSSCPHSSQTFLEVGAAHCFLATQLLEKRHINKYIVVEPNPTQFPDKVEIVKSFVELNYHLIQDADCVIHSHVLEHVYNPRTFFEGITKNMREGANLFISVPNIPKLIELRGANSLNFEHTYLLDDKVVEYLASINCLDLISKQKFQEHSIFFHFRKNSPNAHNHLEVPSLHQYSSSFLSLWRELSVFVVEVNKSIQNLERDNFLFGAHIFSQSLLALGLREADYLGVLDNSLDKQGKVLYGSNLHVFNPRVISEHERPTVILVGTHYDEEIRKQLTELNSEVLILRPSSYFST